MRLAQALIVEPCDFSSTPAGGQLSFAKDLLRCGGDVFGVVGESTSADWAPGHWTRRVFEGHELTAFATRNRAQSPRRPLIPHRFSALTALHRQENKILSLGCRSYFTQAPEVVLGLRAAAWTNSCYCFPGTTNPLDISRYWFGRLLAPVFDLIFFRKLRHIQTILASADEGAIRRLIARSRGALHGRQIKAFPTRVDTDFFVPGDRQRAREALQVGAQVTVLVFCGRMSRVKGWELILRSFAELSCQNRDAVLLVIGDGEDRGAAEAMAANVCRGCDVRFLGQQPRAMVRLCLQASDVYVCGSRAEGWSVAMLEALASGLAIVSTKVSGTSEMVIEGVNGFVLPDATPAAFAAACSAACRLADAKMRSCAIAERYSLHRLLPDLEDLWPALAIPSEPPRTRHQ